MLSRYNPIPGLSLNDRLDEWDYIFILLMKSVSANPYPPFNEDTAPTIAVSWVRHIPRYSPYRDPSRQKSACPVFTEAIPSGASRRAAQELGLPRARCDLAPQDPGWSLLFAFPRQSDFEAPARQATAQRRQTCCLARSSLQEADIPNRSDESDLRGFAGSIIWILNLAAGALWLRVFSYAPLEWVWRSLVHGKRQPLLR